MQAVCQDAGDTSAFAGPFSIRMPITNDAACAAETLPVDGMVRTFNNVGATVATGESDIAPPVTSLQSTTGWGDATLNGTLWYKFVAPASGNVRINATARNYDGQAAVYSVAACGNFGTYAMLAANDNAIGSSSLAPNFTVCGLTSGNVYYLVFDGATALKADFKLALSSVSVEAGVANTTPAVLNVCSGSPVELSNTINGQMPGGTWSSDIAAVNASISGSTLATNGLIAGTYNLQYRVADGCAYDSVIGKIKIFAPSTAGADGTLTACKNQPLNLFPGLGGTADLNGTWYTPAGTQTPNGSNIVTAGFQGNYNYKYITGNTVCPNDTAVVVVNVLNTCDFLDLQEQAFAGTQVFPNPSSGVVFITSDSDFGYEVTDANGRIVTAAADGVKAAQKTEIDLGAVQKGIYFIRLKNEDVQKTYRIVVN